MARRVGVRMKTGENINEISVGETFLNESRGPLPDRGSVLTITQRGFGI